MTSLHDVSLAGCYVVELCRAGRHRVNLHRQIPSRDDGISSRMGLRKQFALTLITFVLYHSWMLHLTVVSC